jgi:hypothetical protein
MTGDLHRSLPAVFASLGMAVSLAPIAYRQFGTPGLAVVSSFAAAIVASVWLAAWGTTKLSQKHEMMARLFASSGVRMVAPLIIAVAVVLGRGRIAPVESVYYVVPLYLCMLIVDVVGWIREAQTAMPAAAGSASRGSIERGEVG